jgi:hypothetical protein
MSTRQLLVSEYRGSHQVDRGLILGAVLEGRVLHGAFTVVIMIVIMLKIEVITIIYYHYFKQLSID